MKNEKGLWLKNTVGREGETPTTAHNVISPGTTGFSFLHHDHTSFKSCTTPKADKTLRRQNLILYKSEVTLVNLLLKLQIHQKAYT